MQKVRTPSHVNGLIKSILFDFPEFHNLINFLGVTDILQESCCKSLSVRWC